MPTVISIKEYELLTQGTETDSAARTLSQSDYNILDDFIRTTQQEVDGEIDSYLQLTTKNGRKAVKAKNYVGVVMFPNGLSLEILPKTASDSDDGKQILLNMLRTLTDSPFKLSKTANLSTDKLPLFEIFIRMFVDSVMLLQKHGFRSAYTEKEGNETCCKGKLIVTKQIRQNFAHAERFYITYDEYNLNRPMNRLIKSTLELLLKKTGNWKNKRDIVQLLDALESVPSSTDYASDFSRVVFDHGMDEFRPVVSWCNIFLNKRSFTPLAGSSAGLSLLFDMNRLFEDYVAAKLRVFTPYLRAQDKGHYLFENGKKFPIRPDIVIGKNGDIPKVLDTKWKLLGQSVKNYGISQADMYQMYVYHTKYHASSVTLLYPHPGFELEEIDKQYQTELPSEHGPYKITINIEFVNLNWKDYGKEDSWEAFARNLLDKC